MGAGLGAGIGRRDNHGDPRNQRGLQQHEGEIVRRAPGEPAQFEATFYEGDKTRRSYREQEDQDCPKNGRKVLRHPAPVFPPTRRSASPAARAVTGLALAANSSKALQPRGGMAARAAAARRAVSAGPCARQRTSSGTASSILSRPAVSTASVRTSASSS